MAPTRTSGINDVITHGGCNVGKVANRKIHKKFQSMFISFWQGKLWCLQVRWSCLFCLEKPEEAIRSWKTRKEHICNSQDECDWNFPLYLGSLYSKGVIRDFNHLRGGHLIYTPTALLSDLQELTWKKAFIWQRKYTDMTFKTIFRTAKTLKDYGRGNFGLSQTRCGFS